MAATEGCRYYGDITLTQASCVGGIAGQSDNRSIAIRCDNYGTIGSGRLGHVGGVVGSAQIGARVFECGNYGTVSVAHHDCVGGVVGYANDDVHIIDCLNAGSVTAKKSGSNDVYLGGILGYVNSGSFGSLSRCFNFGRVEQESGTNTYTGALVGWINQYTTVDAIADNSWLTTSAVKAVGTKSASGTLATPATATVITNATAEVTWSSGWYVALSGTVTLNEKVYIDGDVKLFLADGATLNCQKGIILNDTIDKLTIYAQSEPVLRPDGTLDAEKTVTGSLVSTGSVSAAIGGEMNTNGTVCIRGGVITATSQASCMAGIGGGKAGAGGTITITGGFVTATGGNDGAGIGGGQNGDGGVITVSGGTVTAIGGESAAGIGGGSDGNSGTVTISGGRVTATDGTESRNSYGAGVGGGSYGAGETITITGGTVVANGGRQSAAIGGHTAGGTIRISGGVVTANAGGEGNRANNPAAIGSLSSNYSASTITVTGSADITAVGSSSNSDTWPAFHADLVPALSTATGWQIMSGSVKEALETQLRDEAANVVTTAHIVRILPCVQHGVSSWECTYTDENTHTGLCRWCGIEQTAKHVANTQGHCFCSHQWDGTYMDCEDGRFVQKTCTDATPVTAADRFWPAGWYVVTEPITLTRDVTVSGDVHLILADGGHLSSSTNILVLDDASLTVYSQTLPVLDAEGAVRWDKTTSGGMTIQSSIYVAALGAGRNAAGGPLTFNGGIFRVVSERIGAIQSTNITVNGAVITAKSGSSGSAFGSGERISVDNITINSGVVHAFSSYTGSAIGGGYDGAGGNITINGGTVMALASYWSPAAIGGAEAAGIGTGSRNTDAVVFGDILITDGTVTASGGGYGAGVGSGHQFAGTFGNIRITGGTVTADGNMGAAGIGIGRAGKGTCGAVEISGGKVSASGGSSSVGIGVGYAFSGTFGGVSIRGGTVTADGGESAVGIGLGSSAEDTAKFGGITISGGSVIANGGQLAPGIGVSDQSGTIEFGGIAITGGLVTANGGKNRVGIGAGQWCNADLGGISISGGLVTANGGENGAGIGLGMYSTEATNSTVLVDGGIVTAVGGSNAHAFTAAPTLGTAMTWQVLAGATVNDLAVVTAPIEATYTDQVAVRLRDGVTGDELVSVDIYWRSMEFTYTVSDWDPKTHQYAGGIWKVQDGDGKVTLQNNGNVAVTAAFAYAPTVNEVSGNFTETSLTLAVGERKSTVFSLVGQPSQMMNSEPLGSITVAIAKSNA